MDTERSSAQVVAKLQPYTEPRTGMDTTHLRRAAVAGSFYPADSVELRCLIEECLAEVEATPQRLRALVVPHAGLIYSGRCAAQVFGRVVFPRTAVIIAPDHSGASGATAGVSCWSRGAFDTPLGSVPVEADFCKLLEAECALVEHDPRAHQDEHAIEVELPFFRVLAPETAIVPILVARTDWPRCKELATAVASVVAEWPEEVLMLASSDMTHYEPADIAAEKDAFALEAIKRIDGPGLLDVCRRKRVTMCGCAAVAIVIEAARQLGATNARVVDYRHSGWVTGDDSSVVAYAGVLVP